MTKTPFFSVIIVCLNAQDTIKLTIESVLSQTFNDYEIIVKDGQSIDNTLDNIPEDLKIKKHVSQDNGIYDAMNQALTLAKGRYAYFLNCGDTLYSKTVFEEAFKGLKNDNSVILAYGDFYKDSMLYKQPRKLSKFYLYRTVINHQATFWDMNIFRLLGNFNTTFQVAADYDLEIRSFLDERITIKYINTIVCKYLGNGYSDSIKMSQQRIADVANIRKQNFTKLNVLCFSVLEFLSLRKLRRLIDGENSPKIIRKLYRKTVNILNNL